MIFVVVATRTAAIAHAGAASTPVEIRVVEAQGRVEIYTGSSAGWTAARTNQILHVSDHIRTGPDSRMALRWSDQSIISFGASVELEIVAPHSPGDEAGLNVVRGLASFFHRGKPGNIQVLSQGTVAGVEGTEFLLAADGAGTTTLSVIDGKVRFANTNSSVLLTNGEQAVAEPGKKPVRTAGFIANNLLQWCFYYPAVIDPDELQLTADEEKVLSASLEDYHAGNLLGALDRYPTNRTDVSDREKIYHAALLLSVGEVEKTEAILSSIPGNSDRAGKLRDALRQLIAAVKRQPSVTGAPPQLASELLAASYFEQSRAIRETSLENALRLARQAAAVDPNFGFARERVAELEFSFGRLPAALKNLDASLALSGGNAQALALKGFILSAEGAPGPARKWFDRAIAADAALGNAWLGRGLCKIRLGDNIGGRDDLLVAAAFEPQRSELRSYLGKAYAHTGDDAHATKELALAKKLDPDDPTPFLYSALLNQENNQINDAIRDLEKSQSLNDNRSVYRSQLLLDEDSAARSANLASIYDDAGLSDVSVREAGRAVSTDYANYSAHLFLANSYEQLRSPDWSNLRYDAPSADEFWIANLLAPTGAGWLDYSVAEQPYHKLFEQDRFGINDETTYLSRGAWYEEANQFYTSGNFSYNLGTIYQSDPGQFPNNSFEMREVDLSLKGQLTPRDSLFGTVQLLDVHNGDNNQYFDPPTTPGEDEFSEYQKQEPNLTLGYHHEWAPGVHTLFFATHRSAFTSMADLTEQYVANFPGATSANPGGPPTAIDGLVNVSDNLSISPNEYSTELQQVFEQPHHTTIFGVRYEWGDTTYKNYEVDSHSVFAGIYFSNPPVIANQNLDLINHELSFYGYHTWQMFDSLALTAGVSYDWLHEPADVSSAPFASAEKCTAQFSPKAGIVWTPLDHTTIRAAYTRSLTGFTDSEDYRIEPTEVAGFNQSFTGLIPTSVGGDTSGSRLDTCELSLEQKFDTGTYLSLSAEILYSRLDELAGNYIYLSGSSDNYSTYPLGFNEFLNYRERSVTANADQLIGKQWSVGGQYRVSQANLATSSPQIPASIDGYGFQSFTRADSVLQTINLHVNWNSPTGLFSLLEANWYRQNNSNGEASSEFWQFNAYAGYRFWHRRAEITLGLLNIGDQDYHLDPLNIYNDLPRSRTFLARLRFSF